MASNFRISIDKDSDCVGLKLAGDFDATSAYELINTMKKLPENTVKIAIHTNGLKNTYPFGLDVFHRFMRSLSGPSAKIVFTGNWASQLEQRMAELRATLAATKTITEKELIAAAILNMSPPKGRPLITFNCAALPANLGEAGMYLLKS